MNANVDSDVVKALERSQKWLVKFMADRPENDLSGLKQGCERQFKANEAALKLAKGE